jgi:hypothetical protein
MLVLLTCALHPLNSYNCYIGGDPARMANAVLLARDVVKIMREGDQVQVGGAMILDGNRPKVIASLLAGDDSSRW